MIRVTSDEIDTGDAWISSLLSIEMQQLRARSGLPKSAKITQLDLKNSQRIKL